VSVRNTQGGVILKVYLPHVQPDDASQIARVVSDVVDIMGEKHAYVSIQSTEPVSPQRCKRCIQDVQRNS
jgi:hypothetical protein